MTEVLPAPRELTSDEVARLRHEAFEMEVEIKAIAKVGNQAWWAMAWKLHDFGDRWRYLGAYENVVEFIAQPEIALSYDTYRRMRRVTGMATDREIDRERVSVIEPTKVDIVRPAILSGAVEIDDALDDATANSKSDLIESYTSRRKDGSLEAEHDDLDAEEEKVRVRCDVCGGWYVPEGPSRDATERLRNLRQALKRKADEAMALVNEGQNGVPDADWKQFRSMVDAVRSVV